MPIVHSRRHVLVLRILGLSVLVVLTVFLALSEEVQRYVLVNWYLRQLDANEEGIRKRAAERLGDLRAASAIPHLIVAFRQELPLGVVIESDYNGGPIRGRMDPAPARMPREFMSYEDLCREALCKIGEPAIQDLIKALYSQEAMVRRGAADTLGLFGAKASRALCVLEQLKNDSVEDRRVRYSAAVAIMKIMGDW